MLTESYFPYAVVVCTNVDRLQLIINLQYLQAHWVPYGLKSISQMYKDSMESPTRLCVLVAAAQISSGALTEALSSAFELRFITSLTEVAAYEFEQIDVIVCGLYFDESRMFDLLRYAKIDAKARKLPFLCVNAVDFALSQPIKQGIEIACRALGAVGFVDLVQWTDTYGSDVARSKLQQLISNLVETA